MKSSTKKIVVSLLLASFFSAVFFSFVFMMHGPEGNIPGDCPLSTMGTSICPQNATAVAIHHLSAYHAFLDVTVGNGFTTLITSLLFVFALLFANFIRVLMTRPPTFGRILYDTPFISLLVRKIIGWLSLLENSPSTLKNA